MNCFSGFLFNIHAKIGFLTIKLRTNKFEIFLFIISAKKFVTFFKKGKKFKIFFIKCEVFSTCLTTVLKSLENFARCKMFFEFSIKCAMKILKK